MAKSKYEYVKKFEIEDRLLPNTFIVVRIDGRSFHKFTSDHTYAKPNDINGLQLMNAAAKHVMESMQDIILSYGQSDEYSFILRKSTTIYQRRQSKIMSAIVSLFSSAFVYNWPKIMPPDRHLQYPPSFDGRCVCYPSLDNLRDYLSWRQADCHINNLYNTAFWTLVIKGGRSGSEAEKELSGSMSAGKNELLFSGFGVNYNLEPDMFRKGSVLFRRLVRRDIDCDEGAEGAEAGVAGGGSENGKKVRMVKRVSVEHIDIITNKEFWSDTWPSLNP